jgi:hypothetical protein
MANSITIPPNVDVPLPSSQPAIPPLENGDRLTRAEFERRYHAMPLLKKAELIEGVVHLPSPVRMEQHGEPHLDFVGWMAFYRAHTPFVRGGDNSTVRLDLDNEPQPDGVLLIEPSRGGKAKIDSDGYIAGSPELAGEITASTVSIDLGPKLVAYRRNGIPEYVVWRVLDQAIDWFVLREGTYDRLALSPEGHYQSEVFPGLWLDPAALVSGNLLRVYQVLQEGLQSPAHAEFVARLKK